MFWMKQDQNEDSWFTTMVDYHALPSNFPGRGALPPTLNAFDRVVRLEDELSRDIAERLDELPVSQRFVPYVQLHEFEALLFSDPAAFQEAFPGNPRVVDQLTAIRAQFASPEEIDGDLRTIPSRRILDILPDYQKPVAGLLVARRIGLAAIRRECGHFNDWLTRPARIDGSWDWSRSSLAGPACERARARR